ncbi:hypothetical protein ACHAW5_000563 [Stephanodiscus triporus]|uniref:PHD-type domain-containing protein n=1 Tax=Stephanodiscus triporus TaxID=2934178 RepID=A0ABD3NNS6_9STRA
MWDARAHCLLESLSRMGHEDEDYASVPAAINMSKGSLARAAKGRRESSIGIAKQTAKECAKEDATMGLPDGEDEEEEDEDETRLKVKPTRVLKTYEQRRKFIVKAMDMHRRTIGGGRSGRRGRAECVSFFRRVLEILDEQYEEALGADGVGDDEDEEGSPRGIKGRYVKSEEYGERSSSSEEEDSSEEEEEGEEEEEEEDDEDDEEEVAEEEEEEEEKEVEDVTPKQKPTTPQRKGPGRPRKSESTSSPIPPKKPKSPKPTPRVVLNEQDFFDQHNDLCEVCNQPGEVLCCATCNLVFHVHCARPKLKEEPPDDWKCAYCWAAGVMGGKKDGKERRKAAQACREMERMRRDIKEMVRKRAVGEIVDLESGLKESEDDGDENLAAVDTSAGAGSDGVLVSVEVAAVSGCRKCVKELATGVKTRKTHDDFCPRKWKSVGKPIYASPAAGTFPPTATARVKREEESPAEDEEDEDEEEKEEEEEEEQKEQEEEEEEEDKEQNDNDDEEEEDSHGDEEEEEPDSSVSPSSQTSGLRDGGMVPLEVSAAAGCIKCQKELKTGEKTRKVHADNCPRKYRGAYMLPTPTDTPSTSLFPPGTVMEVGTKAKDDTKANEYEAAEVPKEFMSNVAPATADAATETTYIAVFPDPDAESPPVKRRKVGRPPSKKSSAGGEPGHAGEKAVAKEEEEDLAAIEAIGDLAEAMAKEHEENNPGDGSWDSKTDADGQDEFAMTLRGGDEAGEVTVKLERSDEVMAVEVPSSSAALPGVSDSSRRSDGDNTTGFICCETARRDSGEPEYIRGGGRPKKEDAASPASATLASTSAPRRGRPPTKQTKGGGTPKKNAKRAPIKKETNDNIAGVGVLNRKPGSLFDCSACLDIGKIKICCYCACRLCFNKFGKEQTILCDKCDQEYHTFCLGLDKIPDAEWECPACIEHEEKKVLLEQRKKEREAKKKIEEEKRKEEEAKKEMAAAKRRAAYQERKKQEEEKRRVANEQKRFFSEKRKLKESELRPQGFWKEKTPSPVSMPVMHHKRGPGRPPKAETMARMHAQYYQQQQQHSAADAQPMKRGRGRPRKDGGAPIPRKLPIKSEISMANLYFDNSDSNVERSRSGRKIQRTVFHDEMEGGGLMKRPRSDEHGVAASASRQASMYLAERSAAAAAKSGLTPASSKKEPRRKPGARECMQISRKFSTTVIDQKYFDVLTRMDEHSRFLEAQLAGLEALVKEKGEWTGEVPAARSKADNDLAS